MNKSDYPFNLIRAIYGDDKNDNTHTQTTYIKGLYEQLETLERKEQMILSLRFHDGLTLKACGERIGVTQERIRQIINRAMRKLRHRSRTKHYETVTRAELELVERNYRKTDEENQQLKEALHALGGCGIDPHAVILLANMVRPEHLDTHIGELSLSTRAYNGLLRAGILTVKDVIATPEEELKNLRNLGEKSMQELKTKIKAHILLPVTYQDEQEDGS